MKKILFALMCTFVFISCEKEEQTPDNNNNGGNNNPPTGFTPPTESYWRINGTANSNSAEAVQVDLDGNFMGINRPFTDLNYGYCQLRVFNDNWQLNIRDAVPEGGFKEYFITMNDTSSSDSLRVELDVQDQNSETAGNYFYRAIGGKIYVSKLNGKLRYTSDDELQMSGVKYPAMQDYIYSSDLEFSQVQSN